MSKVLITGITGQDGSWLAEKLLAKEYEVHGVVRRASTISTDRVDHIYERIQLHRGDVTDFRSLAGIVKRVQPNCVYNLAAQSQVRDSFDVPDSTHGITFGGAVNVYEAVRLFAPEAAVYQASSSEMFGNELRDGEALKESTSLAPVSPYGIAKTAAHHTAALYRDAYGMDISCGILFNHESERRGETFVTQKIAKAVAEFVIKRRDVERNPLKLGNLSAARDWGYAPDYMDAAILMVESGNPSDYVVATGRSWSVKDFLVKAFKYANVGHWSDYVVVDQRLKRPNELHTLIGDASKIKKELKWQPTVEFAKLVEKMVDYQIDQIYSKR